MSLFVFFISLLIVAQHVSGNHVPIIRSWRLRDVIASCWYCAVTMCGVIQICLSVSGHSPLTERHIWITPHIDTEQYQHEAKTSHSRQLLMVGTWLPEPCWATSRREIRNTQVTSSWFSYPHWITMHGQPHIRFIDWGLFENSAEEYVLT